MIVLSETGAGQGRFSNGIKVLGDKVMRETPPESILIEARWFADSGVIANSIRKRWKQTGEVIVNFGHSKGANGINDVNWKLLAFGIPVFASILCDGFGDKIGTQPIVIPKNVEWAYAYRSRDNIIEGSDVVLAEGNEHTKLMLPASFDVPHWKMDELPVFVNKVLEMIRLGAVKERPLT